MISRFQVKEYLKEKKIFTYFETNKVQIYKGYKE